LETDENRMGTKTGHAPSQGRSKRRLRRLTTTIRVALEAAHVRHAPWEIIEPLATVSGMLAAAEHHPRGDAARIALQQAQTALSGWNAWRTSRR
jgi:hypothetical protein